MYEVVGYTNINATYSRGLDFPVMLKIDGKEAALNLEELYKLKEVIEHMIVLAAANEIKGE